MSPFASNPNLPNIRSASMYDHTSLYQAGAGPGSFYAPQPDNRTSSYSLNQFASPSAPVPAAPQPSSRPPTQHLPEMDWAPLDLGEAGVSDAQLESSIRRICGEADLDTLTKKGVRKELEREFGVALDQRKETINRIIEQVLNGESTLLCLQ